MSHPAWLRTVQPALKRIFDIFAALVGLAALSPVFVVIAVAIKLNSRGSVFFRQERVGRDFHSFFLYKFRTMVELPGWSERLITVSNDPRITSVGRFLRRTKIDELPQLFNVLKGDMSFVGPRPELARYVEYFRGDYAELLRVRPGMTDPASTKFIDEAAILAGCKDPDATYIELILPEKIRLAREYITRTSIVFDLVIILRTLGKLFRGNAERHWERERFQKNEPDPRRGKA